MLQWMCSVLYLCTTHMHTHTYARMYTCTHTHTHMLTHICTYVHADTNTHMCTHTHTNTHMHIYMYMYTHTHTPSLLFTLYIVSSVSPLHLRQSFPQLACFVLSVFMVYFYLASLMWLAGVALSVLVVIAVSAAQQKPRIHMARNGTRRT